MADKLLLVVAKQVNRRHLSVFDWFQKHVIRTQQVEGGGGYIKFLLFYSFL